MATEILPTQATNTPKLPPFFRLNAAYAVSEGADSEDLINDVACLLEGVDAIMQTLIDGLSEKDSQMCANLKDAVALLFSAKYQTEMAKNAAMASLRRVNAAVEA